MSEFKGYFLGFTFKGTHSSDLKIVRVNTGNRFDKDLFPQFKDSTVEIVGRDGIVYYNTQIQQYQITLNFAYDSVTETDIKAIRNLFSPMETGQLIFDEYPYKSYTAKVTTPAKLSYIVFDEGEKGRIYKGEGSVTLTCFYPYAKAPYKTLEAYNSLGLGDIDEWSEASGILTQNEYNLGAYDKFSVGNNSWNLYNPGDKISPTKITFTVEADTQPVNPLIFSYYESSARKQTLCLDGTQFHTNATIVIDSERKIITQQYGDLTIKNGAILAGDFITVPITTSSIKGKQKITINNTQGIRASDKLFLDYSYLYI